MARANDIAVRSLLPVVVVVLVATAVPGQGASISVPAADVAVITNPECAAETRGLVRFDLPEELDGMTIEFAVVEFRACVAASDAAGMLTLDVFPVATEWSGGAAAWADGWTTAGGDYDRTLHAVWTAASGEDSVVRFDVTTFARAWASGARPNNGIIVLAAVEGAGGIEPAGAAGGPALPTLTVYYTTAERHDRR